MTIVTIIKYKDGTSERMYSTKHSFEAKIYARFVNKEISQIVVESCGEKIDCTGLVLEEMMSDGYEKHKEASNVKLLEKILLGEWKK